MAYSELIKSFERVRSYLKEFYVYGFRTRDGITIKSSRSYDNERRRIEDFLGEYMGHGHTKDGKNVYLAIDTRSTARNPLYKVFKAKSFTAGDITLHFVILDILAAGGGEGLSSDEICAKIDSEYMAHFEEQTVYDESTVRKKLGEYDRLGLLRSEKRGRKKVYLAQDPVCVSDFRSAVEFFSETAGCGVVGSFLLDRMASGKAFTFKHHYISGAIDSEIAYEIFGAIRGRRALRVEFLARKGSQLAVETLPLKILVSAQNGRQYMVACNLASGRIESVRLDRIAAVTDAGDGEAACIAAGRDLGQIGEKLDFVLKHSWGVSFGDNKTTEHVEFTVRYGAGEEYIYNRIMREKRIGCVEKIGEGEVVFKADLLDASEIVPWIRTFIGRIGRMDFSDRTLENRFKDDMGRMYEMYGLGDDEGEGGDGL